MQNRQLFSEYMAAFSELYDKEVTPVLSKIYWQTLNPYTDSQCRKAFETAVKTCRFFPKPAELLELIDGTKNERAAMAWLEVDRAARSIGAYSSVRFQDPAIHSVIESMGGWAQLLSTPEDEWKWRQKEFERLYPMVSKGTSHPDYLPGICETRNAGKGFEIEAPVNVMTKRQRLKLVEGGKS